VLGDVTNLPSKPAIVAASTGGSLRFDQLYEAVWRAASVTLIVAIDAYDNQDRSARAMP
jgi:hypothetical protein